MQEPGPSGAANSLHPFSALLGDVWRVEGVGVQAQDVGGDGQ
jgi:hypothetical protein